MLTTAADSEAAAAAVPRVTASNTPSEEERPTPEETINALPCLALGGQAASLRSQAQDKCSSSVSAARWQTDEVTRQPRISWYTQVKTCHSFHGICLSIVQGTGGVKTYTNMATFGALKVNPLAPAGFTKYGPF